MRPSPPRWTLDEQQDRRGYGPCLGAADSTTTKWVPDTTSEQWWPDWAAYAEKAGAYSSLSIGLPAVPGLQPQTRDVASALVENAHRPRQP